MSSVLEAVSWLDAQAWQSRPLADFTTISGPLHGRVALNACGDITFGLELTLLKRWVAAETWCEEMASVLEKHDRPARRRKPSEAEFFSVFALWMIQQLEHEKMGPPIALSTLEAARVKLENSMSADRRHTLLASVGLPMARLKHMVDIYRTSLPTFMKFGKILAVDESFLTTEANMDHRHNLPPFMRSVNRSAAPHVGDCMVQRLLLSKSPVITNLHLRDEHSSADLNETAVNLILQMENEFRSEESYNDSPFLVLLDANCSASNFLCSGSGAFKSKFIGSVASHNDTGPLRQLVEVGKVGLRPPQAVLLHSPKLSLTAYLQGSSQSPWAVITDAFAPMDKPDKRSHRLPISEESARSLASWNASDFDLLMSNIDPLYVKDSEMLENRQKAIFELTGHDTGSPVNEEGFVTNLTLQLLTIEQLQSTAHMIGADVSQYDDFMNKDALIHKILEVHPRAMHVPLHQQHEEAAGFGDFNNAEDPTRDLEQRLKDILARLLEPGPEPDFYSLYANNFGIDDRLAYLRFEHWQHTYSKSETSKYAWLLFYVSLVNVFAFSQEIQAECQVNDHGAVKPEQLPSVMEFCVSLVHQIAAVYGCETPYYGN